MSNLKNFLQTVIKPVVSDFEFTEDNVFYSEVMLDVDELLSMLDIPEENKITFNKNEILKKNLNKTSSTSSFLEDIRINMQNIQKLEDTDLALVA